MKIKLTLVKTLACIATVLTFSACQDEKNPQSTQIADEPEITVSVQGGELTKIQDDKHGTSLNLFPTVKRITFKDWKNMTTIPKTGIFLVGSDHLPLNFKEELKEGGLTLLDDGILVDANGNQATLFLNTQSYHVIPDDPKFKENARTKGYPFDFLNYTHNMYWKYSGGYCRDYQAWTNAYAWGPIVNGEFLPTSIEYIYTRASIDSRSDIDYCYNCPSVGSKAKWDIGCLWPAHGKASGTHYAYWKDGSIILNASWSWRH